MIRRRTAAAADDGYTVTYDGGKPLAKIIRCALIKGTPINDDRMACIGHERERQGACAEEMHEFLHRLDAADTVEANSVNVAALHSHTNKFLNEETVARIAAGEGREGCQDECIRTDLLDVCRCLDQPLCGRVCLKEEVTRARRKEGVGQEVILLDDVSRRQSRDGADVGKDIRAERLCRTRGDLEARAQDALDKRRIPLIDNAVRRKGVGLDRLRTRTQILRMDLLDHDRSLDVCEFHALAARMRLLGVIGTHAAVKDERLFLYMFPYIHALLRHIHKPPCCFLLSQYAACDLDNAARISRVVVRADLLRIVLGQHSAADNGLTGMPCLVQGFNGLFHRRDRRRHERRKPDQPDLLFDGDLYDARNGYVAPEVDNLVAVVLEDDLYNVLADVVDVPLYRGEDDLAL